MDVSGWSKEQLAAHREMTEALRKALVGGMSDVERLCADWESVHAGRMDEIARLERAIRQAEAHYRFEEAERLKQQLQAV